MRIEIILDWEAEAEAEDARQWYAGKNPAVARRFVASLRASMEIIREAPERWAEFQPGVRRVLLDLRTEIRTVRNNIAKILHKD